MKKNKTAKTGIIVAILLLAVGFAAITTTLVIDGTAKIVPDSENFEKNVIFTEATATEGATATISTDGKTITFTTQEMKNIGDEATLTYKIKNASQYDALIGSITCEAPKSETATETENANADAYGKYLTVTPSNGLNGTTVAKGTTSATSDTVKVVQKRSFVSTDTETTKTITFKCTIPATAKEAE